jgi:hypothetical protein
MCEAMLNTKPTPWEPNITSKELFISLFLEPMLTIGRDRVVNVRMQLSESIANNFKKCGDSCLIHELPQLKQLVAKLKGDPC